MVSSRGRSLLSVVAKVKQSYPELAALSLSEQELFAHWLTEVAWGDLQPGEVLSIKRTRLVRTCLLH